MESIGSKPNSLAKYNLIIPSTMEYAHQKRNSPRIWPLEMPQANENF